MNDDKTQPISTAAPAASPTATPAPATTASSPWDLPADNIALNGLPQGKTDAPAAPSSSDFTYSKKDDSFGGDDQKSLADKMIKSLESEERKPYSGTSADEQKPSAVNEPELRVGPNMSSTSLNELEKKISDQKEALDGQIQGLVGKKAKLDSVLAKISSLQKEESDLVSEAENILG